MWACAALLAAQAQVVRDAAIHAHSPCPASRLVSVTDWRRPAGQHGSPRCPIQAVRFLDITSPAPRTGPSSSPSDAAMPGPVVALQGRRLAWAPATHVFLPDSRERRGATSAWPAAMQPGIARRAHPTGPIHLRHPTRPCLSMFEAGGVSGVTDRDEAVGRERTLQHYFVRITLHPTVAPIPQRSRPPDADLAPGLWLQPGIPDTPGIAGGNAASVGIIAQPRRPHAAHSRVMCCDAALLTARERPMPTSRAVSRPAGLMP